MNADGFCQRASFLLHKDRARTHGSFIRTQENIASLWNAYLSVRREPAMPLGPTDIAIMMALLKIARTQNGEWNDDSIVDAIAYLAGAGGMNENAPSTKYGAGLNHNPINGKEHD